MAQLQQSLSCLVPSFSLLAAQTALSWHHHQNLCSAHCFSFRIKVSGLQRKRRVHHSLILGPHWWTLAKSTVGCFQLCLSLFFKTLLSLLTIPSIYMVSLSIIFPFTCGLPRVPFFYTSNSWIIKRWNLKSNASVVREKPYKHTYPASKGAKYLSIICSWKCFVFFFLDIWETQVNVNSLQTSESGVATQISVLPWCTPERHKLCLTPLVLFKTPSCDEFKKWSNKPPCPLHIQLWQTLTLQVAKPAKQSMHAFPSGRPTWVEPRSALVICGGKLLVVRGRGLPGLRKVFLA